MPRTTLISSQELLPHLQDPDWVIVDCRFDLAHPEAGARAWREGHIPGARYAHLEMDLSAPVTPDSGRHPLPDPQVLAERLGRWGIDSSVQVVVYNEQGGMMATRLWWLLHWLGHENVAFLDGGIEGWQAAGGELDTAPPTVTARIFSGTPRPDRVIETTDVLAQLNAPDRLLIDVRAAERYHGEHEPIDPVAGHVPGAINVPLQINLDSNGCFKPAGILLAQYRKIFTGHDPTRVSVMCGSGVTACHTLLALEHAGLPGARLYSGSWSEWIRNPERPVATRPNPTGPAL